MIFVDDVVSVVIRMMIGIFLLLTNSPSKIGKVRVSCLVGKSIIVVVLLLEMLIGAEFTKKSEKYMKRFNDRFAIL